MSFDTVEQNGKTYVMGDPRAYVVIMREEGVTLSMSMLANVKFRMDWDEDSTYDEKQVMTDEVAKAFNALKPFMKSPHGGYSTTKEFTPDTMSKAIELLETAKDVLKPVIPFEEVIGPIKAVKSYRDTLNEMIEEGLSPENAQKKKELEGLKGQMEKLQEQISKLHADASKLSGAISEEYQSVAKEAQAKLKDDGLEEAMLFSTAPFNATTRSSVYSAMQAKEHPGILVGPEAADSEDFDTDDGDGED